MLVDVVDVLLEVLVVLELVDVVLVEVELVEVLVEGGIFSSFNLRIEPR